MFENPQASEPVQAPDSLIGEADPPPVEVVNEGGAAKVILTCDHASAAMPAALGTLGLDPAELGRHICYDIGIAEVGRALCEMLDAPLVLAGYSRLVIDVNRRLDDPTLISVISDGAIVPGNRNITNEDKARRIENIYRPYHQTIDRLSGELREQGVAPAIISLHSFTTSLNRYDRPWHFGILWRRDARIAVPLMERLGANAGICVGDNQPYSGGNDHGISIESHAESRGLPHALIEIRQDLVETDAGAERNASLLADALGGILDDPGLYRVEHY
ncbi:MAG: N-formylglutamate amidohydrolase [Alphaproteobacteria bacterium]|nr:N-formylglutamate amidohydrolase [Alphaproteobacteria bacterium]